MKAKVKAAQFPYRFKLYKKGDEVEVTPEEFERFVKEGYLSKAGSGADKAAATAVADAKAAK